MESAGKIFLADDAQEVLDQTLSEADRETIHDVYKDINATLLWGRVLDNAFPILLELAEELIETGGMCKSDVYTPWYLVSEETQELFDDEEDSKSMSRKHLLLLWLSKKLLGGLKTRVNQSIEDIRVLPLGEEIELEAIIQEGEQEELTLRDSFVTIGPDEPDTEEGVIEQQEVVAEVDISPEGTCIQGGNHVRTTTRWKKQNAEMFMETYCKDCRTVLSRDAGRRSTPSPKECRHPSAVWVEGKEGEAAECADCGKPTENPERFRWTSAGLEPFGDDPSKDEATKLCSEY